MIKYITAFLLFCASISACSQGIPSTGIKGVTIDTSIKREAEKHIEASKEFDAFNSKMEVFINTGEIQSFENDKSILKGKCGEYKAPFKSFYLWNGDTLLLDGAFGLFGGIGFGIEIVNNEAKLYHMLSSDDFPTYAYNENDSFQFRLEVPCTDVKIVLSDIPDSTKNQLIYGYVEFKSANYYSGSSPEDGKENLPRQKTRNNMKLYFKSRKLVF
jgi:hypothetical protein